MPPLTPIEWQLYEAMRAADLAPRVQYGVREFRVDFAFPDVQLAVEADGRDWHDPARDQRRDKVRAHAEPACEPELDEDELIDELTQLLRVSGHSDGFGFDLLSWLPPAHGSEPKALCLEVKSTSDGTFHLSRAEWERAKWFQDEGVGDRYAVLVVHRARGSGPPRRLDLLPDPGHLVESGQLTKTDDGYEIAYHAV